MKTVMWKRIFLIGLTLALILAVLPFSASAEDEPAPVERTPIDGSDTWWEYRDGVLTIGGEGEIPKFTKYNLPWGDIRDSVVSVVIEDGVTEIGRYSFHFFRNLTDVRIPDSVTTIAANVFDCCRSLESIVLPEKLKSIPNYLFDGCFSLKNVTIPEGVKSLGSYSFSLCKSLKGLALPASLKEIDEFAFDSCESLESITLPEGVETIERTAFRNCFSLKSIVLPEKLTSVGEGVFLNCTALESVHFPAGVKEIGEFPFRGCVRLHSVSVDAENAVYESRSGCLIEKESKTVLAMWSGGALPEDGSVAAIGRFVFEDSTAKRLALPGSVTSLGLLSFDFCASLRGIVLPEGLKKIERKAFVCCDFLSCVQLAAKEPPELGEEAFQYCSEDLVILVPEGSAEAYRSAWTEYADRIYGWDAPETAVPVEGTSLTRSFAGGELTLTGEGSLPEGCFDAEPWSRVKNCISSVLVGEGVTELGSRAFAGFRALDSMRFLAEEPPALGADAFAGCGEGMLIIVPTGCGEAYRKAWSGFADRLAVAGDSDGDDRFDALDYLTAKCRSVGVLSGAEEKALAAMDVEADGLINAKDLALLREMLLQKTKNE